MDRDRFLAEATESGMDAADAEALYARLYEPAGREELEVDGVLRAPPAFSERSSLSRVVQICIWFGVFLIAVAQAWWWHATSLKAVQLLLALLWLGGFTVAAEWARARRYRSLSGGLAVVAVCYLMLTVYAFERLVGLDGNDGHSFASWFTSGVALVEVTGVVGAAWLVRRQLRPFLMLPLAAAAAAFALSLLGHLLGGGHGVLADSALVVGALLLAGAVRLDYLGWRRFAFWPHLVALSLLLGAIVYLLQRPGLLLAGALLLVVGVWLARSSYLVVGAMSVWAGFSVYSGPLLPVFALLGGLALIAAAILLVTRDSALRRLLSARQLPSPQRDRDW